LCCQHNELDETMSMEVTKDFIKKVIYATSQTCPQEVGCNYCFDKLHNFAEMKLEGKSPEEAMPLVKDHLKKCSDCQEEYQLLLEALQKV